MEALLVYSNFAFWFPAFRSLAYGHITRFVIFFIVPLTSGGYHACRSSANGDGCLFGLPYPVTHASDFVVAQLAIPLSALYLIHWKRYAWLERIFILGFLLAMIFAVIQGGDTMLAQAAIASISILIVVAYWIGYAVASCIDTGQSAFPKYEWGALLCGIALTGQAIALFWLQNKRPSSEYWVIHSAWHIQAAFGQWYILATKAPAKDGFYRALDADMNKIVIES